MVKLIFSGGKVKRFDTEIIAKSESAEFAEREFRRLADKTIAFSKKGAVIKVQLIADPALPCEKCKVVFKSGILTLTGGRRGIIYAVYEFFTEFLGCRFFTPQDEQIPCGKKFLKQKEHIGESPFFFRDICDVGSEDKTWSLENKINSDLWERRGFSSAEGGGISFAGCPVHTLTGEYLLKPYVKSHPEYFALVNGERKTGADGQICFSAENLVDAVYAEMCNWLEKAPHAMFISVSKGDNGNFCQCPQCAEKYGKKTKTQLFAELVVALAKRMEKSHPNVFIHTLAYEDSLAFSDGIELPKNVVVQFCTDFCRMHAITDSSCAHNTAQRELMKKWLDNGASLFVWDYVNCFKYQLFQLPDIWFYHKNIAFFAKNGVAGVFNENAHRSAENCRFATFRELKNYLLAKCLWKPYMSDGEYEREIMSFVKYFYGAGGKYVYRYLKLLKKSAKNNHLNYNCGKTENPQAVGPIVDGDKLSSFLAKGYRLLYAANRRNFGDEKCRERTDLLLTHLMYYEQFWLMETKLQSGDKKKIADALHKNEELIDRIVRQNLVITFWGKTRADQNAILKNMQNAPPSKWDYSW